MAKDPKKAPPKVKWWQVHCWPLWHAGLPTLQRSPIPSLANLIEVDRRSWEVMSGVTNILSMVAVVANLALVITYAAVVSSQSVLPLIAEWDEIIRYLVIGIFCLVAVATAIVMQLGTDFLVPFSAGLASDRYRVVPTLGIALWLICAATTVVMKVDVYTGWGRERIAEASATTTTAASDAQILVKYRDRVPPPVKASEDAIANAEAEILRLEGERTIKAAARDQEDEVLGGRGERWAKYDAEVQQLDRDLAGQRANKTTATANKANRLEYDDADARTKLNARAVKNAERDLLYDSQPIVWARGGGMAAASFMLVLMSFMMRASSARAAKREDANAKRRNTNEQRNAPEGEWTEAAPAGTPQLPFDEQAQPGVVAGTDFRRHRPGEHHPDAAGDNFGAWSSGYGLNEGGADAADDAGKPQGQ